MTQKQAVNYAHRIAALLAAYRFLDLELLHNGTGHLAAVPSFQNCITFEMIQKETVKVRWRKLNNWRETLVQFRDLYENVSMEEEDVVTVNTSPLRGSLTHLQSLADSHSTHKFSSVIQNFRGAALHWTVLHEMAHQDTNKLPVIPESISDIIGSDAFSQLPEYYLPHTHEKMDAYLREHRQGELVLPLHLSLMLTPCFLLMPITLVKSKFPPQSITHVSVQRTSYMNTF